MSDLTASTLALGSPSALAALAALAAARASRMMAARAAAAGAGTSFDAAARPAIVPHLTGGRRCGGARPGRSGTWARRRRGRSAPARRSPRLEEEKTGKKAEPLAALSYSTAEPKAERERLTGDHAYRIDGFDSARAASPFAAKQAESAAARVKALKAAGADAEAIEEAEEGTSLETTSSTTTTTVPPLPKSCPAPDVTYNGSLLASVEAFKDIHDVEFEVRTGPFPGDSQRCKLSCVKGQWVGPLCRTDEGMYSFFVFVCLYFETRDRSA